MRGREGKKERVGVCFSGCARVGEKRCESKRMHTCEQVGERENKHEKEACMRARETERHCAFRVCERGRGRVKVEE